MTCLFESCSISLLLNNSLIQFNSWCPILVWQITNHRFCVVTSFTGILGLRCCRVWSRVWCRVGCLIGNWFDRTRGNSYWIPGRSCSFLIIFSSLVVRVFLLFELFPLAINLFSIPIKLLSLFSDFHNLPYQIVILVLIHGGGHLILLGSLILFGLVLSLIFILLLRCLLLCCFLCLLLLKNSECNKVPGVPENIADKLLIIISLEECFIGGHEKWRVLALRWLSEVVLLNLVNSICHTI